MVQSNGQCFSIFVHLVGSHLLCVAGNRSQPHKPTAYTRRVCSSIDRESFARQCGLSHVDLSASNRARFSITVSRSGPSKTYRLSYLIADFPVREALQGPFMHKHHSLSATKLPKFWMAVLVPCTIISKVCITASSSSS